MIGVSVVGAVEAARGADAIARGLEAALQRRVAAGAAYVREAIQRRMTVTPRTDPFFGVMGSGGDGLSVRTGTSRSSIAAGSTVKVGDTWQAAVGSALPHMAALENGATISGNQFLRIPLAAAQTAQGVDRYAGMSARAIPNTFILRTLGGRLFVAQNEGKVARGSASQFKGRVTLLYLLVHSVTLKGHHTFQRASEDAGPTLAQLFGSDVRQVIVGGANAAA